MIAPAARPEPTRTAEVGPEPSQEQLDALLALALSQPTDALAAARGLLDTFPRDPRLSAYARQAIGIVMRDSGDNDGATAELKRAERAARRAGEPNRVGDVLATLAVTVARGGQPGQALSLLATAITMTDGVTQARVRMRRAHVLLSLGRAESALEDLKQALRVSQRARDTIWEARCRVHSGWANEMLGRFDLAEAAYDQAAVLFEQTGQEHEAAWTLNNRAMLRWYQGDIPAALALLDAADDRFEASGSVPANTMIVRCRVLLSAGLIPEALALVNTGLPMARDFGSELALHGALAALGRGDPALALRYAAMSRNIGSPVNVTPGLLESVEAQSAAAMGELSALQLSRLADVADSLSAARLPDALATHLLVGRLAHEAGLGDLAKRHLGRVASSRDLDTPMSRMGRHLAIAVSVGDSAAVAPAILRTCGRGLDAFHEHVSGLGDRELRAFASQHAQALSDLALATALRGTPRTLLRWSERVRASSLVTPPARPPMDAQLARAVASAREAEARLLASDLDATALAQARRDQARHEGMVRRRYRQLSTQGGTRPSDLNVRELVAAVGTDALVSLVHVDGILYAVRVHRGRVTRHEVGPLATALRESEFARFAMRRAAYGRVPDLGILGARVESALLGDLGDRLPERVVVVPPAALHTAPWGLLPSLSDRVVGVAPSARLWLRARAREREGPVVFVGGPGLSSEQAEVTANRRWYAASTTGPRRRVRTLTGPRATAAAATRALDGAAIAHLAAHGSFRADAPLFSSVRMHDGPLYLYDLDRLHQAPHTVILSACDVGDTAAVGVDEGLGLVTGLLGLGTSAVLASTVPVNDGAAVLVTGHLHEALAAGSDLPTAWRSARRQAQNDAMTAVTAASFTAWGA